MFSPQARFIYKNNQLAEVICQLRYPEILAISANPPVEFQEAIRGVFPRYSSRKETNEPTSVNYQFVSQDGYWKVNLTNKFISLACNRYTCWEDFADQLDLPLAAFIKVYKPAYFERIGLRYLNFFSRKHLELEDIPFADLFSPCYLGILSDVQVAESSTSRSSVDAELNIRHGCRAKIHAGPGMVKRNGESDPEIKFIFDQDLYMLGNVPVNLSAETLETLHGQAYPIFRDAITDMLHEAMEPETI